MRGPRGGFGWVWPVLLAMLAAAVVVFPAAYVACDVAAGVLRGGESSVRGASWVVIGRTVWVVGLISVLATAAAWPAAWASRWLRGWAFVALLAPMLLPSYLAYAAWGLLRAPGTWLGDFLLRGPAGAGPGGNWYPVVAGRAQAVLGLVVWAWPLAALVMAITVRRVDEGTLESLRLDPVGRWRRGWQVFLMVRGGVGAAVAMVALVMLGSAVPLHVAQFDTLAIDLWRRLDEVPQGEHWRIWAGFWPLVVAAILGAWVVSRRMVSSAGDETEVRGGARGWGSPAAAAVVWGVSVVVPVVLLVVNLRGWRSMVTFWRANREAVVSSAADAAWVAAITAVMAVGVWVGLMGRGRKLTVAVCGTFLAAGLMPGVLVGSALARGWGEWGWLARVGESQAMVVIGHLARFGAVACLGGWMLARSEGQGLREMREMDAGGSVRGWVEAALRPRAGMVAGVALAAGLLSLHEIEAAVMLRPASAAGGGFSWKLLQALHFNREDDLVAGMLLLVGAGLVLGAGVVAGWGRGMKRGHG